MRGKLADPHGVALAHIGVDRRHLAARLLGRDHAAAGAQLQGLDPLHVVGVTMRDDDLGERPAGLVERLQDRRLLGGVHGGAGAGRRILDQRADVVGQTAENADLGGSAAQE
jgi:hypothetical protein